MASIYRRKAATGVKAEESLLPAKRISRHDELYKFDRLDWVYLSIGRLTDENRRLEILAESLRADIVRLVTRRYAQH